jgi:protease-4
MERRSVRKPLLVLLAVALVILGLAFGATVFLGEAPSLRGPRVALVVVDGVITDSREIVDQLERAQRDPTVRAVVVRINSPGGGVAASQEIHGQLTKLRTAHGKPVVASMASVAASGGYYVASASDRIVANPGSITGSIGVLMQIPNVSGLLQKIGVRSVVIKSGEHKDLASPTRELTEGERRLLQEVLDDVHDQFIEAVMKGRKLTREKVAGLADGRIFSGRQALALGLVDELGDLQDAIQRAGQLAGIPGRPRVLQQPRRRFRLLDLVTGLAAPLVPGAAFVPPAVSLEYLMR